MTIARYQDRIVLTDDSAPDRDAVVILLPAEQAAVKAAISDYYRQNQDWSAIRQERNRLLAESDWTRLDDATADKDAWAIYRQALRDITLQPNPLEVQWPVPPQ